MKLCMFCGQPVSKKDLTREHFVMKGLWEKLHRPKGMKTLPAHRACNEAFATDNEYFRDVLAFDEGSDGHPAAEQLRNGTIRRKLDDPIGRGNLKNNIKNPRICRVVTKAGIDLPNQVAFDIDLDRIHRVLRNVMKGVFYVATKEPMPTDFLFSLSEFRPDESWDQKTVAMMVPWQSFGDTVFRCRYIVSSRKPIQKIACLMQFYGNRTFIGEAISPAVLGGGSLPILCPDGGNVYVPASSNSPILVPPWVVNQGQRP